MTLDFIQPNIHPVLVHFAYALTVVAAGLYALGLVPRYRLRPGLSAAADWSLYLAGGFIVLTIAAGFQAYYSVAHDTPSHEAMTTHRNWAVPTGTLVLILAGWRWFHRAHKPSAALASAAILSAGLLSVTAWWGGHLVYTYGLGVQSLPEAGSGDGHDHDHGTTESGAAQEDDSHQHGSPAEVRGQGGATSPTQVSVDRSSPRAAVETLQASYAAGDEAALRAVLSEDLLVAEGGRIEDGLAAYAAHHMTSDLAAAATRTVTSTERRVQEFGDAAVVLSDYRVSDSGGEVADLLETAVLSQDTEGWSVTHLHWSFSEPAAATEKAAPKRQGGAADPASTSDHGEPGHAH